MLRGDKKFGDLQDKICSKQLDLGDERGTLEYRELFIVTDSNVRDVPEGWRK